MKTQSSRSAGVLTLPVEESRLIEQTFETGPVDAVKGAARSASRAAGEGESVFGRPRGWGRAEGRREGNRAGERAKKI